MPQVQMKCQGLKMPSGLRETLPLHLTHVVAQALHVEEVPSAHLVSRDVEVAVTDTGLYDKNVVPLSVTVWAHDFPERSANIQERTQEIADAIKLYLEVESFEGITGCVWIPLSKGYVTF